MKKFFFFLLALVAGAGTMSAWDYERVQIGDLYYNLDATNQAAEVTSQNSDYPYWSTSITTANIPSSVEYNSVTYSVTSIRDWAFEGCTGLTSVTIPNSVTSIGSQAFSGCSGLNSVHISDIAAWCAISFGVNSLSYAHNLYLNGELVTDLVIPNSVTSIGECAFYNCSGLTSVTIPNSVTSIGRSAFYQCISLTSVTIGNSVTNIGSSAFYGCSSLTSVTIPNSVTSIGDYAFEGCSSLTSIEIPNSVTSIGKWAFAGCSGLTSIEIPNSVTNIGWNPFEGATALASMQAPAAFFDVQESYWPYYTKILSNVTVTGGELTENALLFINRSYKTLQTLDVSGVTNTEFADEAFKDCYNLRTLKLPAGLTKIGYMAVAGCKNLQSIDIPASVEEIEQSAFEDCRSLQTITFGGSANPAPGRFNAPAAASQLKRIGNWAFYNAHELQHLTIPEGVTEIGDGAFYGCTYLEDLVLPSSVRAIGDNCFALCSKLTKIVVNSATPPEIEAKTFYDVKRQIPVYVPDEAVSAYEADTYWQEFDIQGASKMPTGINDVSSSLLGGDRGRLILRNGQVFILRGEKVYTITGIEVK